MKRSTPDAQRETLDAESSWRVRGQTLDVNRPIVMGIINVTPDSFSDGGQFFSVRAAVNHGKKLRADGADILDIGGESTRPQGATAVDAAEEMRRVMPVIEALLNEMPDAVVSIDTVKSNVAERALSAGAHIVNDVSGFRLDPRMGEICATAGAGVVLMHSRGDVTDMGTYAHARYDDVVTEVFSELRARVGEALDAGVAGECIAIDPGIGFAKRAEHSLALLAALPVLAAWKYPVLVGLSRKRFLSELAGVGSAQERVHATVGANVAALERGARIFRVHDVAPNRQALDAAWAIMRRADGGAA